jgi:hypothetical protein
MMRGSLSSTDVVSSTTKSVFSESSTSLMCVEYTSDVFLLCSRFSTVTVPRLANIASSAMPDVGHSSRTRKSPARSEPSEMSVKSTSVEASTSTVRSAARLSTVA